MLYWLTALSDGGDFFNLFRYITFRAGGAFMTALIFGFIFGKPMDLTDQSASDTVALAQQTRREKLLLTAGEPELPQLPLAMPETAEAHGPRLPDIDADIDTLAMDLDVDGAPMPADAEDGSEDTAPAHDRARAVGAV